MVLGLLYLILLDAAACSLISSAQVAAASEMLTRAYKTTTYSDRLMLGRKAQLGDDMVYRPGLIASPASSAVDTALTYGEYDLNFFAHLVDLALDGMPPAAHFVDVGSGVGRLVLAAAMLWPSRLQRSSGVECVADLHRLALEAEVRVRDELAVPCDFVFGDAETALDGHPLSTADVCFAYSTAFAHEGEFLSDFSRVCGTCLRVGTRVVTTDRRLLSVDGLWSFEVLDRVEGINAESGGEGAVGWIHEVTSSRCGSG